MSVFSKDKNFLWLATPKCASESIGTQLLRFDTYVEGVIYPKHGILSEYEHVINSNTFCFMFVRNPWDLIVSKYFFHDMKNILSVGKNNQDLIFGDKVSFNEWVSNPFNLNLLYEYPVKNQIDYALDKNNTLRVNKFYYFENFESEWEDICGLIGIENKIPKINETKSKIDYKLMYDEYSYEIVKNSYIRDINYFKYKF